MTEIDAKLDVASEDQKVSQRSNECKHAYFGIYEIYSYWISLKYSNSLQHFERLFLRLFAICIFHRVQKSKNKIIVMSIFPFICRLFS